MPIPTSRSELLDAIEGNFAKAFKDLETVPATRCHETTMEGHAKETMMSVHNLVSYLVGWNHLVLKWIDLDSKGDAIEFLCRVMQVTSRGFRAWKVRPISQRQHPSRQIVLQSPAGQWMIW